MNILLYAIFLTLFSSSNGDKPYYKVTTFLTDYVQLIHQDSDTVLYLNNEIVIYETDRIMIYNQVDKDGDNYYWYIHGVDGENSKLDKMKIGNDVVYTGKICTSSTLKIKEESLVSLTVHIPRMARYEPTSSDKSYKRGYIDFSYDGVLWKFHYTGKVSTVYIDHPELSLR